VTPKFFLWQSISLDKALHLYIARGASYKTVFTVNVSGVESSEVPSSATSLLVFHCKYA
jgi:hypothetical protein